MTIIVKIPTDYPDLESGLKALFPAGPSGLKFNLHIESGHALTAPAHLIGGDYSHITITSDDAVVNLIPSFPAYGFYKSIFVMEYGRAPIWDIVVDGDTQIGRGLMFVEGALYKIAQNKGVINCNYFNTDDGAGLYSNGSMGTATRGKFTGCTRGAWFSRGSAYNAELMDVSNAMFIGAYASRGSSGSVANSTATNAGTIGLCANGALMDAQEADVSGAGTIGALAESSGTMDFHSGIAQNCGTHSASADGLGRMYARDVDGTGTTDAFHTDLGGDLDMTGATGNIASGRRKNWQTADGLITDNAADSFPKYISNANGNAVQFADGTMICWNRITISYIGTTLLRGTWTFPAAFSSDPRSTGILRSLTAAPTVHEVGAPNDHSVSTSSVSFDLPRIQGMTNFASGNTALIECHAIGRWY